jgi:hypothetical protein
MSTLEFLPSIKDNEAITCPRCNTRQYPRDGKCLRCHSLLKRDYLTLQIEALQNSELEVTKEHLARVIGTLLRGLRRRRGICQSQLVIRAADCISRTSLSKAECGHMLLPLYKLLPLAEALGLTAVILRFDCASNRATDQSNNRG